ncbi:MAG TPA: guanylate kinase [Candidatus Acidoferrales bacterium]|nr:guanylate kinase [Candidatus Acidoferrales bacterium]
MRTLKAKPSPNHKSAPLLILISAPSGAGKTTLVNLLLKAQPRMMRVVTCTTREPRPGERDGVDYHFLTATDFLKRVQAGNFIEHATVFGNSYGILKSELLEKLRAGRDVLLNVDVQGAATIRLQAKQDAELRRALVTIFLTASADLLAQRLKKRGADAEAVVQKRLAVARQEISQWKNFDYLILSGSKQEDLRRALVIIGAEKMRSQRSSAPEF